MLSLDDKSAFVTTFITKPELRGKGIGKKVWAACEEAVKGKNIIVNAAPDREQMYNKLGFTVSKNRMEIVDYVFPFKKNEGEKLNEVSTVVDYQGSMFEKVYVYDRQIQPIERRAFVKSHIEKSDAVKVALLKGEVVGYVCLRKNYKGYMVMPLYADADDVAKQLLHAVVKNVEVNTQMKLGIPSGNPGAKEVFKSIGCFERPYNPMYVNLRMHTTLEYADELDEKKVYSAMNYSYVLI